MKRAEEQTCCRAAAVSSQLPIRAKRPGVRQSSAAFPRLSPPPHCILAAMAALLILSGCAVGPNYKPPQTAVATAFANTPTNAASADETALATWWKGFNDAKLNDLVGEAIAHNHDLRIATANLKEARALRRFAMFDLAPSVQGNA